MRRLYAVLFTLVAVVSIGLPAQANPIDSLAPGHWYKVPNSHLQDVALQPVDFQLHNIMDAWSGGAFDTKRHRLIVWGGGHSDYWGNEIYTFNVDILKWQRINDPYLPAKGYKKIYAWGRTGVRINPINPDGTPDSRHTYDGLVYLPNQDRFWENGGSIWPSGAGTHHTAEFNFDTGKWKYKADVPHGSVDGGTAYDPATGHIFEQWCGWIMEYDPVANTWATRGQDSCYSRMVGEIDPVNRKFVILGSGNAFVYNITPSGTMSRKPLNAVGNGASVMKDAYHPGLVYDSAIKRIVGWASGADVYTLDLSTSPPRWEKLSPAADNTVVPTPPAKNGTYGRWQYVPSKNAFILVNGVGQDVYFYKLPSALAPTSTSSPSTSMASLSFRVDKGTVVSGGSVRLTWSGGNVSRCTASGGWRGAKAVSGSEVVGPLSAGGIFTLTCSGSLGSVGRSVAVSVTPTPSASPPALPTGGGVSGPAKPVLSSPGSGVGVRARIAGAAFSDADASATLKGSEWEVGTSSGFGAGSVVLDRRVEGNPGLSLPSGVLGVGKEYWVRTRHQDSQGKWSAWSGGPSFTTVAVDPRDMDGNGVDDRYQVAPGADANGDGIPDSQEGMCDLHDAQGGAVVGFKAGTGVVRCLTSVPVSALSGVSGFPGGSLPYGMFAFRIKGLPVDPAQPATAQVEVYFPQALGAGAKWYQYDVVTGRVEPFPGAVSIAGNHATLTLVDGGAGDADGVVNGVIVDPSGPVTSAVTAVSGGTPGGGGGGAVGPGDLLLGLLAVFGMKRRRMKALVGLVGAVCVALLLGGYASPAVAGASIDIPVGKWIAIKTPARHKGVYYGDSTYDGMKHVSIALDPLNGRLYFEGGDYSGASGFHQSYQQETWSLDLAARLSDPTNRNAGWRLEYPYCGPSGQIQPKHPDTVGWVWDSRRNVFWIVPGVSVSSPALCSGETYSHNSDPGFIFKHMMTFNPATKKWTDVSSNVHGPYGNNWKAVYGPKTDTIIRFGYRNSAIAQVYNISKNTWTDYPLGKDALGRDIRVSNAFPAVDLKDRVIYVIDHSHGRLHRYHMDSHTMDDLGPIPGGPRHFYETYIAWDSTNRVLFWFDNIKRVFNIYHPDTKTWQTVSTATNIPGINAYGRTLIYDAHDNVLVLMGGVDPAPPSYFYLYRFGSGSGASPSVPVASLSFSADKGAVVSGGGVRLTWNGGNVSRCTASGGWSGAKAVSGSEVIGPLSADGIFTLTCSGSSGSVARSVAVSVTPAPAPSASPPALPTGGGVSGPAKPVLSSPGSGVGVRARIAGAAFSDTDASATLKESEWEVGTSSGFGAGAVVLDRRVAGNPGLSLPFGVLGVGKGYWVRTRHQDSQGKWSAWSGGRSFTTVAVDPEDTDGNGVDDRYQVAPGADANGDGIADSQEGICDLHDAQGGAVVGIKAGTGVARCLTSVPVSALSGVSGFPGGSLPYGMFAFRIEGLPVDPAQPATAQVEVYFPKALGAGAKWYQYDVVTDRVEPFPGAVSIAGNRATLTLVDGGAGDADGVVNGVIVDPSGPVVLSGVSGVPASPSGGGAVGPFGIGAGLLAGRWLRRRRKRAGPSPA